MREPFYLVCGYGETGQLICRALDQTGLRAVVIELDDGRVSQLDLHSHTADIPALAADARQPEILKLAGLTHRRCQGVLALTNDDSANLAIAIAARLLAPGLPALCRAETAETATNMASFGTRHIINPFEKFGRYLALALHAPAAYHLLEWLTGLPGTVIKRHRDPPRGHWLLCGYGRFGKVLVSALEQEDIPVTVIDYEPPSDSGNGAGCAAMAPASRPCWKRASSRRSASSPAPTTT
ncbi:MAG: NAD-binding protein [Candidatus Competibacteraceae bacterium]|nr:NAD-binding protein [Candidatus Competibacteraceae bacterium]